MAKNNELDMLNGALLPKILMFSLPLALTGILQLLFNAADVIVVGKFAGSTSLAAVGATSALVNLLTGAFIGISVGVNILVARYAGCRDDARVGRAVHSAIALSLVLGVVTFLLGFFLSTPMLEWMDTPDDVLALASLYLRIYFIGIPGALIYNFAAATNIAAFTYTAMNSVFHASITFTSQNLGARRYHRVMKIFWACQATVLLIGIPLCILSTVFGPQLLSIYVSANDPAYDSVIAMGLIRTYYVTTPYFLCGIMEVCCGMVRGLGKSWLPMIVTIFGACILRIIWIYTIFAWDHTLPALYISYPISWVVTAAMHAVCFAVYWKRLRRQLEAAAPERVSGI